MKTPKTADDLRDSFLKYFETKNHLILPSSSLIPSGDPSLLLTNSGMAQFKSYFSGEKDPPNKRITTAQKCFRTTDIEEVGDDTHLTFFEMLGNFSFGDYFKNEACAWALEYMTEILNFDINRLFFTIYNDDDEAKQIWLDLGISEKYIYKFGDEDNWWGPAGDEGPCGPCSEIHYYQGDLNNLDFNNPNWGPNLHEDFIELYNLVFTQFYRDINSKDTPLPFNNIDTGMGLERTLAVLTNNKTVYKTDVFSEHLSNVKYKIPSKNLSTKDIEIVKRIIAEHGRSASFLIADGVIPENTGRGYVLRRLIRRAIINGIKIDASFPILSPIANISSKKLSHIYPELDEKLDFIKSILDTEEEKFSKTLNFGTQVLYSLFKLRNIKVKESIEMSIDAKDVAKELYKNIDNVNKKDIQKTISGLEAFRLYDTYGFPIEITEEICTKSGLDIDRKSFIEVMNQQKNKSKQSSVFIKANSMKIFSELNIKPTEFVGYEKLKTSSKVLSIIQNEKNLQFIKTKEEFDLIIDKTPFYAEKGGQIGDSGIAENDNCKIEIIDTITAYGEIYIHKAKITEGSLSVGNNLNLTVDGNRRERIRRNHTATHLIHAALREIVGIHVRQSGSLVHPNYLRFDFTNMQALDNKTLQSVEDRVNDVIRNNLPVEVSYTTYDKAIKDGALAFFGEKYDHEVRTIKIDKPWSYELCGGTHMSHTGGIGLFKIISENGIGSGNRRILALTGIGTETMVRNNLYNLNEIMIKMNASEENIIEKFNLQNEILKKQQKKIEKLQEELTELSLGNKRKSDNQEFIISDTKFSISKVKVPNIGALRKAGDTLRNNLSEGVAIVGSIIDNKPIIVIMTTVNVKIAANDIASIISKEIHGGGGGNKFTAQVGGKDPSKLDSIISNLNKILSEHYK
jgi:alanyl-tRNA synthetase